MVIDTIEEEDELDQSRSTTLLRSNRATQQFSGSQMSNFVNNNTNKVLQQIKSQKSLTLNPSIADFSSQSY